MQDKSLLGRLKRYSKERIANSIDKDFADAVYDAIDMIDSLIDDLEEALNTIEKLEGKQ